MNMKNPVMTRQPITTSFPLGLFSMATFTAQEPEPKPHPNAQPQPNTLAPLSPPAPLDPETPALPSFPPGTDGCYDDLYWDDDSN
jgi:hypothetical protein